MESSLLNLHDATIMQINQVIYPKYYRWEIIFKEHKPVSRLIPFIGEIKSLIPERIYNNLIYGDTKTLIAYEAR